MDTFEFNKIAGAVLGALLLVMGLGFLAELLYAPQELAQAAYVVEIAEEGGEAAEEAPAEEVSLAALLASADADRGVRVFNKCKACHQVDPAKGNGTGPNLHGIVGAGIARLDFNYSDGLAQQASSVGAWSYEALDGFLEAPKDWAPGTKMSFAGLNKATDRANVIAYLVSVSPDAPPFPVEEAAAAVDATEEDDAAPDAAESEEMAPEDDSAAVTPDADETGASEETPAEATDQTEEATAPSATESEPTETPASTETAPVEATTGGDAASTETPASEDAAPSEAPTAEAAPEEDPAAPAAGDDAGDASGGSTSGN